MTDCSDWIEEESPGSITLTSDQEEEKEWEEEDWDDEDDEEEFEDDEEEFEDDEEEFEDDDVNEGSPSRPG